MVIIGVVLAGAVFLLIVSWWVEGYIGATEGLVLFALYGGLVFGLFAAPSLALQAVALVPLLASAIWAAYAWKKGSLRQYYLDQIRRYRSAIDFDPRNLAARRQLADALYKVGDIDMAIAEMRVLAELSPSATEERYVLRHWEEEKRMIDTGVVVCHRCGTENGPGVNWCRRCEAPLLRFKRKTWLAEAGFKGYILMLAGGTVTVLSFVFLPMPYPYVCIGCVGLSLLGLRMLIH